MPAPSKLHSVRRPRTLAGALAAVSVALACASAQAQIKIAMVIPTTGPLTQYGDMVQEGVNTAVELANAAGGIKGQKIELTVVDDACEPKQGPIAANRVVNAGISYAVGPVCSGAAIAAAPIYDNEGVVLVTPSATSPALTDGKNYHSIFRTIGRDDQQGPVAAQWILHKASPKPQNIAVLHDKQAYGQGIATSARDDLQKGGAKVVLFEGINAGDSDYSAVITKLKSLNVDFVYYGGYHPEVGLLLRQSAEQGLKVRIMSDEGAGNPTLNQIAGDAAEGMLLTLPADFAGDPKNAAVAKAFRDKGRDPTGAFQLTAFAATQALIESIRAVGDDRGKVADHLHNATIDTVIGPLSWNRQGDLNAFNFEVFQWHKDGSRSVASK